MTGRLRYIVSSLSLLSGQASLVTRKCSGVQPGLEDMDLFQFRLPTSGTTITDPVSRGAERSHVRASPLLPLIGTTPRDLLAESTFPQASKLLIPITLVPLAVLVADAALTPSLVMWLRSRSAIMRFINCRCRSLTAVGWSTEPAGAPSRSLAGWRNSSRLAPATATSPSCRVSVSFGVWGRGWAEAGVQRRGDLS